MQIFKGFRMAAPTGFFNLLFIIFVAWFLV